MTFFLRSFGSCIGIIKLCLYIIKCNHLIHCLITLLMNHTQDPIIDLGSICDDMYQVIKILRHIDYMYLLIIGYGNLTK